MKHQSKSTRRRGLIAAILVAAFPCAASHAQFTIQQWDFNDANGTTLTGVANSVPGGSSWDANISNVTTNGSGSLVVGDFNYGIGGQSSFALLNGASGISEGILTVDFAVASWAFGTRQPQFYVNVVNPAGDILGGIILDVGGSNAFVGGVSDTGNDLPSAGDLVLPKTLTTPYVFRLTLDYDTFTYAVSANSGSGFSPIGSNTFFNMADSMVAHRIELYSRFNWGGVTMSIDSLTVTAIPEPSTALAVAALLALVLRLRARKLRKTHAA